MSTGWTNEIKHQGWTPPDHSAHNSHGETEGSDQKPAGRPKIINGTKV